MSTTDIYEGSIYQRDLDDGRIIVAYPMLFTFRLCIGPQHEHIYDQAWCYKTAEDAIEAAGAWDGAGTPPGNWVRQIG